MKTVTRYSLFIPLLILIISSEVMASGSSSGGDILSLSSGIYAASTYSCAWDVEIDPLQMTVNITNVDNPFNDVRCEVPGAISFHCSSSQTSSCKAANGASPNFTVDGKYLVINNGAVLALEPSIQPIEKFFNVGDIFKTQFIYSRRSDRKSQFGPDTVQVLQRLPNGGWTLELSGNPMGDVGSARGSGLQAPVLINVDRNIGVNTWLGEKIIPLVLRNRLVCSATISYQVTFVQKGRTDTPGEAGSYVIFQTNWPQVTFYEMETHDHFFSGIHTEPKETIKKCGDLEYFTLQVEQKLAPIPVAH